MKLAGLRRLLPKWEIPAAMRVLQEEKQASLRGLRERRAAELLAEGLARKEETRVRRLQWKLSIH